jgi:hypothetical protein
LYSLGGNKISAEGAKYFADALAGSKLTKLM